MFCVSKIIINLRNNCKRKLRPQPSVCVCMFVSAPCAAKFK